MTLKPESIFVVRGCDVNGNQKGATERRQSSDGAAELARYMLDNGCKAIDIDVLEQTGQTCQSGSLW